MKWFDEYEFKARISPALIALAPALLPIGILGWKGSLAEGTAGVALLVGLGAAVRFRGKAVEQELWAKWGGMPAAERLRKGNINGLAARAIRALEKLTEIKLVSPTKEFGPNTEDPQPYETAIRVALERLKGRPEYRTIERENIAYGYSRNLYAVRPFALVMNAVAILGLAAMAAGSVWWGWSNDLRLVAIAGIAELGLLVFWWRHVREELVRSAADTFSEALIRTLAALG